MTLTKKKDLFSRQASAYAKFRPTYPDSLLCYLSELARQHDTLWDCGTGNGQVALAMTRYFKHVIATDASPQQIQHAPAHPQINYSVVTAEESGLADASVDMITVAQALHWFDFESFNTEVKRILKPGGVIAVWCYQHFFSDNSALNQLANTFYNDITGPYWAKERQHVDQGYREIPFPYEEMNTPHFAIHRELSADALCDYYTTWSAINTALTETGENLIETWLRPRLDALLLAGQCQITWPIVLRVGYLPR